MLVAVEKEQAKKFMDKYFSMLSVTGYVKRPVVMRYLAWLFLVDLVEKVYGLLDDDDYTKINNALICLTSNGCCLLPYVYQKADITWGAPIYMGEFRVRITEDELWRSTQNNEVRIGE